MEEEEKKMQEEGTEVEEKMEEPTESVEEEKTKKVEKVVQPEEPKVKGAEIEPEVEEEKEKEPEKEESSEGKTENESSEEPKKESKISTHLFALRTTANREDQVMDFITSHIQKKKLDVHAVIRPHGMRGYIFLEAASRQAAEESARSIPYARGILPKEISYSEIEHMLEQVKRDINIKKNDIVEIISGPFKREQAKISRIDKVKEEVVVELLEAAVPIPITLKLDSVKVIRREDEEESED